MKKLLIVDAINTCLNYINTESKEISVSNFRLNTELLDAVMLLPINKIMITNVNPAIIQESLGFYPIQVISYLNNPNKNNPQFYNQLLKDINVAAQDCFMFDSKQENLDAASANGIEGILYINNEQMIPILQQKFSS